MDLFCQFFRLEFSGLPLEQVYSNECNEMSCFVIGIVINPEWLDLWVTFCGFGSW